jgi:hypothetical protein
VVVGPGRGDDEAVPEPVTVWMVELGRGNPGERKGMLFLDPEAVRFEDDRSGATTRVELATIRRARRNRGSPILLIDHAADGGGTRRLAFYFSQPPPLTPPEPGVAPPPGMGLSSRPVGAFGAMRRTSKRRHMRSNIGYLTTSNAGKREVIEGWVAEIREGIAGTGS